MPVPQMTIRRWMIAVAVVAIVTGCGLNLERRSRRFARTRCRQLPKSGQLVDCRAHWPHYARVRG